LRNPVGPNKHWIGAMPVPEIGAQTYMDE
jgi:hypothetical protein